jgi:hypothetical protein
MRSPRTVQVPNGYAAELCFAHEPDIVRNGEVEHIDIQFRHFAQVLYGPNFFLRVIVLRLGFVDDENHTAPGMRDFLRDLYGPID